MAERSRPIISNTSNIDGPTAWPVSIVREALIDFVAEHHVEQQPFFKRKRDRADPESMGRRDPLKNENES